MQTLKKTASRADFYEELNPRQREAVDTVFGPLLVLAGPGTGKTQLLSIRAAKILEKSEVLPENILIVTYTNSAAKAIKLRLAKIMGLKGYDIEVGTFHSFANSILQESAEAANYVGDKVQMDDVEQVKAIRYVLDHAKGVSDIRPFRAPYLYLREVLSKITALKKDGITPQAFQAHVALIRAEGAEADRKNLARLKGLGIAYSMYEEIKEGRDKNMFDERGRYDFDDMIIFAREALLKEPALADEYRARYKFIMVDEYQDTNEAQLGLLFTLLDYKEPNLCSVGDDDQSIYRFQGASVGNFKLLKERFSSLKVISLRDNYRSTKDIIDFSSSIIDKIPESERVERKDLVAVKDYARKMIEKREFSREAEEIIFIIDRIKEIKRQIETSDGYDDETRSHPYNNIAILVRKRGDILKLIDFFLQAGIPYATDGKEDISGERRVRQLLGALELAEVRADNIREKDQALYKVLSADYLRIPMSDVLRFLSHANTVRRSRKGGEGASRTVLEQFTAAFQFNKEELEAASIDPKGIAGRFKILNELNIEEKDAFIRAAWAIVRLIKDAHSRPVHDILLGFINDAGILKFILEEYASREILKVRDLRALTSFVNRVKSADTARPGLRLAEFMEELRIAEENGLPVQGELVTMTQDGVRILTAHGSKGQEFHTVFIPFCLENKNWPARPLSEKIILPPDLFKTKERVSDKTLARQLFLNDETRLFYVASTRAKSSLIFTASPEEDDVASSYLRLLEDGTADVGRETKEGEILVKSLVSSKEEKDPFVKTEEVLRDMVSGLSLNPTSLNNYITCRRRFLYDNVLMLPGKKRQSLAFGNCVHKALEETYGRYKDKGVFPDFRYFSDAFERELRFEGVDDAMEARCIEKLNDIKIWFDQARLKPVMPLELEKKIVITIGDGIVFTGKFDKVEMEDSRIGSVKILDYKTGKPDDHIRSLEECRDLAGEECDEYLRQLVAYKLLFERDKAASGRYKVSAGELVFIEPVSKNMVRLGLKKGDFVNKKIEISDNMVKGLEDIIVKAWRDIQGLEFDKLPERDDDKCRNCDFDGMCWGN